MTTTAPDRDSARRANLRVANDIRTRQAAIKRRINKGILFADAILLGTAQLTPGDQRAAERLTAYQLLNAMPYYGVTRTRKKLAAVGIPENKRLQDMTQRQRRALVTSIRSTWHRTRPHTWTQAA